MAEVENIIQELCFYSSEREWFEFKVDWFQPDQLGEYISALANSAAIAGKENAYFVWGIDDQTHHIVGTSFDFQSDVDNEPLQHYLARQCEPDVNFTFTETIINKVRVVLLTIPAAKTAPISYKGVRYIRIGSSKVNLKKYPERESYLFEILRHGLPTMENTPSEYQDLSFEQLLVYYGAKGLKLDQKNFRKNLHFYTDDGKYNILAQILSDNSHLPIRVAIFSGRTKADNMYSIREFGNQCLLYSLDDVLRYGDVLNIIQADETNRVVERKDVPLFENNAFREAVINAFLHNKWVTGLEPMITVFSDRIEILSRGVFAPGQTLEGFFAGESVPVNQKLSEIFLQLHISEKTGRGVPVITKQYGRNAYEFREESIVVKIPFNWINTMADRKEHQKGGANNSDGEKVLPKLRINNTQKRILVEIRNNPNITKINLSKKLKVSTTTIDSGIRYLRKNYIIKRVGSNKAGYWEIKE